MLRTIDASSTEREAPQPANGRVQSRLAVARLTFFCASGGTTASAAEFEIRTLGTNTQITNAPVYDAEVSFQISYL
jgi:hypothetical protein